MRDAVSLAPKAEGIFNEQFRAELFLQGMLRNAGPGRKLIRDRIHSPAFCAGRLARQKPWRRVRGRFRFKGTIFIQDGASFQLVEFMA